jgi:hypothetical protein
VRRPLCRAALGWGCGVVRYPFDRTSVDSGHDGCMEVLETAAVVLFWLLAGGLSGIVLALCIELVTRDD